MEFLYTHPGIAMGLLLAAAGVLVWRFPGLLKGYYPMPAEKQRDADWPGLRRFLLFGFLFLGSVVAALDLLIRSEQVSYALCLTVVFAGVLALIGAGHRYTHPTK